MTLAIKRRIRGNLQGTVDISILEDKVIAHPVFQRLRRIKQTAFLSFVFPGATHTRFEHSLGVMQQASLAWNKIKDNQMRLFELSKSYPRFEDKEAQTPSQGILNPTFKLIDKVFSSDYTLQGLRLAALLHDVGHPPFSHSGERFMPSLGELLEVNRDLPSYVSQYLQDLIDKAENQEVCLSQPVSHEIFTIILVDRILRDVYQANPHLPLKIAAQDVVSMVIPDIAPAPGSELVALQVNKLCHELISGEIDIDRMDYLRRDSQECGVSYGLFEADRILNALSVYYNTEDNRLHLALQYSGLPAFEDYLLARNSMYTQLYYHKTSVACEAMLQRISKLLNHWHLPAKIDDYIAVDEFGIHEFLKKAGQNIQDAVTFKDFSTTLEDLLLNRRLWKKVYESSFHGHYGRDEKLNSHDQSDLQLAKEVLQNAKIPFEEVTCVSSVLKQKKDKSVLNLRLIKNDERQFPRVVPIESYSKIMLDQTFIRVTRLYVETGEDADKETSHVFQARQLLIEAFESFAAP